MAEDDISTCDTCDFYLQRNHIYGECRRYPPRDQSVKVDGLGQVAVIENATMVNAAYWCGEWQCEADNVCAKMIGAMK